MGKGDLARPTIADGQQLELVCLKHAFDTIRSRIPPDGWTVVVRPGRSKVRPVPGEIFTLQVERAWVFGHTNHAKGQITESVLDLPRLELTPLDIVDHGEMDPESEPWLFEEGPKALYSEIRAAGPRRVFELEWVMPEDAVELHWEEDPILEAVELEAAGAPEDADGLLGDLLSADLRCLDAHAHLGIFNLHRPWPGSLALAERHFRVGVALGEMALGRPVLGFPDLLPWGLLDNRPFLRCLHGLAVCRWRQGDPESAHEMFRRLVWLSPTDNLGARFAVTAIEAGRSWEEAEERWAQ